MRDGTPFGFTTKYYVEGFFQTGQFDVVYNIDNIISPPIILFTYTTSTFDWEYLKQEITFPTNPFIGSIGLDVTGIIVFTSPVVSGFSIYGEWV